MNGVEKDGILAECGEVVFHGLDSDAACDIHFFGSQTNASEVYEAEYSTFGRTDNFIALNCNNNTSLTATLSGYTPLPTVPCALLSRPEPPRQTATRWDISMRWP